MLKRVFALDVLACVCGARRRVVAVIKMSGWRRILEHLGLPSRAPQLARAQTPQAEIWSTGPPADEDSQSPALEDFEQRPAEPDEE